MGLHRDEKNGRLLFSGVDLGALAASDVGTPTYVYDLGAMAAEARELVGAFAGEPGLVAYAVKANSAGTIVRRFAQEGCGADVVSGAEMALALGAGMAPEAIVFSGVAKTDDEIDAALQAGPQGVGALQLESLEEGARVAARASRLGRVARVSFRVNPAVDKESLGTHSHIATGHDEAKFGVPIADVPAGLAWARAQAHLRVVGVGAHVGSQFTSTAPYRTAAETVFSLAKEMLALGFPLEFVDTGGGFGIDYGSGCPVKPKDFVTETLAAKKAAGLAGLKLVVEPGRSLVGAHGILLAKVIQPKESRAGGTHRRWLMIDAGMNDLIRPALYQAHHRIVPLEQGEGPLVDYRVVGPVCESSDDFGLHALPAKVPSWVALLDAGAYGYTMASQYNGRALAAEVFLESGRVVAEKPRSSWKAWVDERLAFRTR